MNARPVKNTAPLLLDFLEQRERPIRPGMIASANGGRVRRPLKVEY